MNEFMNAKGKRAETEHLNEAWGICPAFINLLGKEKKRGEKQTRMSRCLLTRFMGASHV